MLKDNQSIRASKASMANRYPVLVVVLLFIFMQIPGLIIALTILPYNFLKLGDPSLDASKIQIDFLDDKILLFNLYYTILVTVIVYLFARYYLRANNTSLGLTNPNKIKNYFKGLGLGALLIFACIFILKLTGAIEFTYNMANVSGLYFLLFVIGWIFQGFEEELMARSVLMNFFAAKIGVIVGIVVNTLIFAILHIGNEGFGIIPFINIFLIGLVFSLLFYLADDIFLPAAAHSMWNFAQGNIFGIKVSGNFDITNTIFKANFSDNPLLTGGDFGLEGSIVVTMVCLITVLILANAIKKRNLYIEKKGVVANQ